jgi:hypothetical protein
MCSPTLMPMYLGMKPFWCTAQPVTSSTSWLTPSCTTAPSVPLNGMACAGMPGGMASSATQASAMSSTLPLARSSAPGRSHTIRTTR